MDRLNTGHKFEIVIPPMRIAMTPLQRLKKLQTSYYFNLRNVGLITYNLQPIAHNL